MTHRRETTVWSPKRETFTLSLVASLVAAPVIAVVGWLADGRTAAAAGLVLVATVGLFLFSRRYRGGVRLRRLCLTEPSASLAADAYLRLTEHELLRGGLAVAEQTAEGLGDARPLVGLRFLTPVDFGESADRVASRLAFLRSERERATYHLSVAVADVFRQLKATDLLVLHGYSGAIGRAIELAHTEIGARILIVRDPIYDMSRAPVEWKRIYKAADRAGANVVSSADLSKLLANEIISVPRVTRLGLRLPWRRETIGLNGHRAVIAIGCEGLMTDGTALIPAVPQNPVRANALHSARAVARSPQTEVIICCETFKILEDRELSSQRIRTVAPIKATLRRRAIAYLGITPRGLADFDQRQVDLARLPADNKTHYVTERGICSYDSTGRLADWAGEWSARIKEVPLIGSLSFLRGKVGLVAFDLNGVLVDDDFYHYVGFASALRPKGRLSIAQFLQNCQGRTDLEAGRLLVAGRISKIPVDSLVELKQEKFAELLKLPDAEPHEVPGMSRIVNLVHEAEIPIAVVTVSSSAHAHARLHAIGVLHRMTHIVPEASGQERTEAISRLALTHGLQPNEVLVFDDNRINLHRYRRAGFLTVGVAPASQLSAQDCDVVISHGDEALPFVRRLLPAPSEGDT